MNKDLNPYNAPTHGVEPAVRFSLTVVVLFIVCILIVLLSLAVSGHAIWTILETTPFMGKGVDARGNPIPIQGYSQLACSLASVFFFTVLTFVFGLHLVRRKTS